jgi:hypothetical protein
MCIGNDYDPQLTAAGFSFRGQGRHAALQRAECSVEILIRIPAVFRIFVALHLRSG